MICERYRPEALNHVYIDGSATNAIQDDGASIFCTTSPDQQLLSNNCRVALQWIPAHCGVPGNEQANKLAKEGADIEQPDANVKETGKGHHYQSATEDRSGEGCLPPS